ncbi:MAG: SUMF1/EgtB/PvdO family nonheme iron enzyme [Planctomycetaceae bacterium]|nr:SUMF1/EgtB/PvdO family nonheme iron enzyme [Planctomycetaceae bacterium]
MSIPLRSVIVLVVGSLAISSSCYAEDTVLKTLTTFRGEFVDIRPGQDGFPSEFQMGSESGSAAERPVHQVRVTRPFQISKYEVWQDLYEAVMGNNPSRWKGPRNSAEQMTWKDAVTFCQKATELMRNHKLIAANETIRLPTEAEWEYCCRAGTQTAFSFGDQAQRPGEQAPKASLLDEYAWHTGNAAGNDPAVGVLKPNPWGLYDVHGYLREYCLDEWNKDYKAASSDAHVPAKGDKDVHSIRGGSWRDSFVELRSAARQGFRDTAVSDAVGFRCVLIAEKVDE